MQHIEKIFKEFYAPLCNYAVKIINDTGQAEDIVQELFVQLWENQKLEKIENPERFLLRSVKFKCIDFIRKSKRQHTELRENIPDENSFETTTLNEEDVEPLLHYFASKLPPKTQKVFLLSRTSGLTYAQIADELNIAVKTVEAHQTKALKIMRQLLKEHNFYSAILMAELTKIINL